MGIQDDNDFCAKCGLALKIGEEVVRTPRVIRITDKEVYLLCKQCYDDFMVFSHIVKEMENMALRMFIKGE